MNNVNDAIRRHAFADRVTFDRDGRPVSTVPVKDSADPPIDPATGTAPHVSGTAAIRKATGRA